MEQLVTVIQRLHEALSALGDASIRLPAIVAVGGQSSGKSSVLESIVGRDFLPRGTGIVTRRPVMMYLHNVPRVQAEQQTDADGVPQPDRSEWAEFTHRPGHRFYNFEDVRAEIVKEMDRVAGKNKGISSEPVCLTINSPRVPDLVIIDLPGVTKVPIGDQPPDIELQIRRLCMHYMTQANNIILAVHPANQDLANSDALKLALEADPEGERTIGVLTKIDLMDPGTDARDVLSGRVISLRRGFVPIVCRSQKDIAEGMPIQAGLTRERAFFERHYAYKGMAGRCGTAYLTRVLSHMLFTAIRTHLPALRSQLSLAAQGYEAQLRDLGDPVEAAGPKEQGHLLLKLLSRFATNFCDMIEGRVHADAGGDLLIDELFGGARLQEVVRTRFNAWTASWESLMDSSLKDEEVLMALRNSAGPRSALFIPEQAFVSLVRRQIVQLKDLGRRFADEIYDELRRIAEKCEPPQLYRFGELREKAVEVVQALLRRAFVPTVDMIDRLIDIELSHINTCHPDFVGAARALELVQAEEQSQGGLGRGWAMAPNSQQYSGPTGGGDEPTGPADAAGPVAEDVAWAMRRLGVQEQAGNAQGVGGSVYGVFGQPAAARQSKGGQAVPTDELRARFGPRVVHEMLSDESGPWGSRRVGGPASPFVEVPRPSPHRVNAGPGWGQAATAAIAGAGLTFSPRPGNMPVSRTDPFGHLGGQAYSTPGPHEAHQQQGPGVPTPADGGLAQAGDRYQSTALVVLPQKPLPEVITPSDLRPDAKEVREIRIIRVLLASYLHIVKKTYTDMVPKTVMCMLVNRVKEEIASELVHSLYSSITGVDQLLKESDDVAERRRELMDQLSVISNGLGILNEIRDAGVLSSQVYGPSGPVSTAQAGQGTSSERSDSRARFGAAPGGGSPGAENRPPPAPSVKQPTYQQQHREASVQHIIQPLQVNMAAPTRPGAKMPPQTVNAVALPQLGGR